jgi:hypothetical protein
MHVARVSVHKPTVCTFTEMDVKTVENLPGQPAYSVSSSKTSFSA